jgi:restriction system protein
MSIPKLPTYRELLWPTYLVFKKLHSANMQEVIEQVIEIAKVTEEQSSVPQNNGRGSKVEFTIKWAVYGLRLFGIIEKTGELWSLKPEANNLTEKEIHEANKKYNSEYNKRKKESIITTSENPEIEFSEARTEEWYARLLDAIKNLSPAGFERLCQFLLRKNGFTKVEVTGRSGDGGVDGVGVYQLGLLSFSVLFQCKRYKDTVSSPIVRDFRGAMDGRADKGFIMTTGVFTSDAKKEAVRAGTKPIELIDGPALCELLIKHQVDGVEVVMKPELSINTQAFTSQFN